MVASMKQGVSNIEYLSNSRQVFSLFVTHLLHVVCTAGDTHFESICILFSDLGYFDHLKIPFQVLLCPSASGSKQILVRSFK